MGFILGAISFPFLGFGSNVTGLHVMFPTKYGASLRGIVEDAKIGAGSLIMAILGR